MMAAALAAALAAAVTVATTRPLAAVSAADREATGNKIAQRGRATSCLGAPGAQALDMRRVPAHRTRR